MKHDYQGLAGELVGLLGLSVPPVAITFSRAQPAGAPRYGGSPPAPAADGRTGAVPAGCVFWMKAAERTFSTVAADHANCSVGSLTHGFVTLQDAAGRGDVQALVDSGWVREEDFPSVPVVAERFEHVSYGPLAGIPFDPEVVLLRINGKQAMMLHDACPSARFEGKPQCHIIAMAREQGEVALSVGCMLSRVRTGMTGNEMTAALPVSRLEEVVERLRAAVDADRKVAAYAAQDGRRFQ